MNEIAKVNHLLLEWIPMGYEEQFIEEILDSYWERSEGYERELVSLHDILLDCSYLIVDAASLIATDGEDISYYWTEIDDSDPLFSSALYNEIVGENYEDAFRDMLKIMDYHRLTYIDYEEYTERENMRHYNVEVW